MSDVVYKIFVAVKICTPFSAADISAGNSRAEARGDATLGAIFSGGRGGGESGAPVPGSARAEAERRRKLALKALDMRLNATASKGLGVLGETSLDTEEHGTGSGSGGNS